MNTASTSGKLSLVDLLSIHCRTCGAPTAYDIVRHTYACAYCGGLTGVEQGLKEKKAFAP